MPRLLLVLLCSLGTLHAAAPAAAVSTPSSAPPPAALKLADLESHPPDGRGDFTQLLAYMESVAHLVETNQLKTGEEFFRAAELMGTIEGYDYRMARVRYELLLAAAAKDIPAAEAALPNAWNRLLATLARPPRIAFGPAETPSAEDEDLPLQPAPACVQNAFKNRDRARSEAAHAKNHSEMQKIVDADQAIRQNDSKDWDHLTMEESKTIAAADRQRNRRTREIVAAGELHTAQDFANASLVMQHSSSFAGYQLAHELAVCSLLLGDREVGRWLVAATYDRMLGSLGHDQRFGTQYRGSDVVRVDEAGICDAERTALGCTKYAAIRGDALTRTAERLVREGRFAEAEPVAREAVAKRIEGRSPDHWNVFSGQRVVGASLLGQKKFAAAEPELLAAYAGLKKNEAVIPPQYKVRIKDTALLLMQLYEALDRPEQAGAWREKVAEFDRAQAAQP